jgi:hypothetical protein
MHDSPEPGHVDLTTNDKRGYVDEKATTSIEDEELEPVVTPKTWVVVGVGYLIVL